MISVLQPNCSGLQSFILFFQINVYRFNDFIDNIIALI